MAHFAELDLNNKVLRVVVGCNQDVENNGGEQSEQAAEYFKTVVPLSKNGVKWVQTSYNNNFRKQYAGIDSTYDSTKNKFIAPKPYDSWSLDVNDDWQPPVSRPTIKKDSNGITYGIRWDEENIRWLGTVGTDDVWQWNSNTIAWDILPR